MGVGLNVGPLTFYSSGRRRRRYHGKNARFHYVSYWIFLAPFELYFWMMAVEFLAAWWLLWLTTGAVLYEVAKFRELPAWWGPVMDRTRPVWPKPKAKPVAAGWQPKPVR